MVLRPWPIELTWLFCLAMFQYAEKIAGLSGNYFRMSAGRLHKEYRLLKSIKIAVAEIYVPVKRQELLDPTKINVLAEAILEEGHKSPILVRQGNNRYVLIEGLHRLEAMKALGENEINAVIVAARRH